MPNPTLESFIASIGDVDPAVAGSLREISSGQFGGERLRSADEWFSALDAVVAMAARPVVPERPAFPSGQGPEREMSLVRQWLGVGRRVGGHVFFGGAPMVRDAG
jgi:hypothetical protein